MSYVTVSLRNKILLLFTQNELTFTYTKNIINKLFNNSAFFTSRFQFFFNFCQHFFIFQQLFTVRRMGGNKSFRYALGITDIIHFLISRTKGLLNRREKKQLLHKFSYCRGKFETAIGAFKAEDINVRDFLHIYPPKRRHL